jgi:hypothetical protein
MKIVETDNHGGDYPMETFVPLPLLSLKAAQEIRDVINKHCCPDDSSPRYWKVVIDEYQLDKRRFEP